MKRTNTFYAGTIACLSMLAGSTATAQNTQVTITELKSAEGQIVLNIYKDSQSYEKQAALKTLKFDKKSLAAGKLVVQFDLEPGTYAIALVDDQNKDGEINKNFLGIPKEGFGFSNFYMEKMKKPAYDDFKVVINPKDNKVLIKAKYM